LCTDGIELLWNVALFYNKYNEQSVDKKLRKSLNSRIAFDAVTKILQYLEYYIPKDDNEMHKYQRIMKITEQCH